MDKKAPELWLLFPHYDACGRREHILLHVFISKAKHYNDGNLRDGETIRNILGFIRKLRNIPKEREEVYIDEADLLRYILSKQLSASEVLEFLPVTTGIQ